jgi:Flp pilus assembly CpaE family ATPase
MTDSRPALVLLVVANSDEAEYLSSALERWDGCRVLSIADMKTALARIAGGGVELVVASLSPDSGPGMGEWDAIGSLRRHSPQLPVIVLSAPGQAGEVIRYLGSDHSLHIMERSPDVDLAEVVRTTLACRRGSVGKRAGPDGARIIAFEGAKGGVGTTTLALNVAAELARHGQTILAEMRLGAGTLLSYFGLQRRIRTIADLAIKPKGIATEDVEACLWPCERVPGLTILFGPQSLQVREDIPAEHVDQILRILSESADYVVVDLPHCFSATNRAVLGASDCLVLVLERDLWCLQAASLVLRSLEAENLLPQAVGAAVVSRVPLAAPAELSEVAASLGIPILGAIPPAPDLCLRAHRAHVPVVTLDPESMLAESFSRLVLTGLQPFCSPPPAFVLTKKSRIS